MFETLRTQSWNLIYLPYSTGDVHAGSITRTYADADPSQPRVEHHRGHDNLSVTAHWLKAAWPATRHVLITGFWAGGVGPWSMTHCCGTRSRRFAG